MVPARTVLGPHAVLGVLVAAAVLTSVVALAVQPARIAYACSADASFDPVAASDVIVGGYVAGYEPAQGIPPRGQFIPVRLDMRVHHVWKGTWTAGRRIIDRASLLQRPSGQGVRYEWAGASGACGALDHDPTGYYAIFGLTEGTTRDDAGLNTNRLLVFYLRRTPYDPAGIERLRVLGLPALGAGHDGERLDASMVAAAALASLTTATAAIAIVRATRQRGRHGDSARTPTSNLQPPTTDLYCSPCSVSRAQPPSPHPSPAY